MAASAGVRRIGAAALDLAWTAAGRFDGFWERNLRPWDLAAGIVILREAGGFVSDAERQGGDAGDKAASSPATRRSSASCSNSSRAAAA